MPSLPLPALIIRGFQTLFGIIVFGLSITLIRGHHWGSLPTSLGFAAFVGGITFVAALLELAGKWFEVKMLDGTVGVLLDGGAGVVNVAGGIFMAMSLNGVQCKYTSSNWEKLIANNLLNGGCKAKSDCWAVTEYATAPEKWAAIILGHCREATACSVFMFLTAILLFVSATLVYMKKKKGH